MEQTKELKVTTRVKVFFEESMSWESGVITQVIEEYSKYQIYLDSGGQVIANYLDIMEETFEEFLFTRKGSFGKWTSTEGWLWAIIMVIFIAIGITSNMGSFWINVAFCAMILGMVFIVLRGHYRNFSGKDR
jgi:hypothetical protein